MSNLPAIPSHETTRRTIVHTVLARDLAAAFGIVGATTVRIPTLLARVDDVGAVTFEFEGEVGHE